MSAKSYPQIEEVWVANGTYYPSSTNQRSASFVLNDTVLVYGGFAGGELNLIDRNPPINIAILSGDIGTLNDSLDNSYHVVILNANCTDSH